MPPRCRLGNQIFDCDVHIWEGACKQFEIVAHAGGTRTQTGGVFDHVGRDAVPGWFADHPNGIVIVRHKTEEMPVTGLIIRSFPYRGSRSIDLLEKPVRQAKLTD